MPSHLADNNVSEFVATFRSVNICEDNEDFGDVLSRVIDFKEPFPSQYGLHSMAVWDINCQYPWTISLCSPCNQFSGKRTFWSPYKYKHVWKFVRSSQQVVFLGNSCSYFIFQLTTFQEFEVQKHVLEQLVRTCPFFYNYCFLEHLIGRNNFSSWFSNSSGTPHIFFFRTPHFSRWNNFPKTTIEFWLRTTYFDRKAIFGFLLEHLDFPALAPL